MPSIKLKFPFQKDFLIGIFLYGILGLLVTVFIVLWETESTVTTDLSYYIGILGLNWTLSINDRAMGAFTFLMALSLAAAAIIINLWGHGRKFKAIVSSFLLACLFSTGFLYLYAARGLAQKTFIKAHDSFHYLLGPKYYAELNYFGLYEVAATADAESLKPVLKENDSIRDLSTYGWLTVKEGRTKGLEWKQRFTEDRWRLFKHDVEFYKSLARRNFINILRDHGYNGTPFHAFCAGHIANRAPLTYRSAVLLSLIDLWGLLLMMAMLSWAFGWKPAALFAIFFFTSFTDRGYFILGSFFRYYWMIPTGIGVACIRKRWYRTGGFMLGTAAMLNVFPLLFLGGIGIKTLYQFFCKHRFPRAYRRFIIGSALAFAVCGSAGLIYAQGIQNYTSFLRNMANHTELATRSRIGFRYLFLLPREIETGFSTYTYSQKSEDLARLTPIYRGTGLLLLLVVSWFVRKRSDTEATILFGMAALLLLFNTVEYYYGVMGLLLFCSMRGKINRFLILSSLLFGGMALIYFSYFKTESLMICHNYGITLLLLAFLFINLIVYLRHKYHVNYVRIKSRDMGTTEREPPRTFLRAENVSFVRDEKNSISTCSNQREWSCGTSSDSNCETKENKGNNGIRMLKASRAYFPMGLVLLLIGILALILLYSSIFHREKVVHPFSSYSQSHPKGVIVFGGDVGLGRRQHTITAKRGMEDALGYITPLKEADVAIVNLECVVAHTGEQGLDKGENASYYFRARPEMLGILEAAGIDIVVTANNHSGDYGPDALLEQLRLLDTMGMGHVGSGENFDLACAPLFFKAGDVHVALFGIDTYQSSFAAGDTHAGNCFFSLNDPEGVKNYLAPRITAAREKADVILVAVHWGANYRNVPEEAKVLFGHALIEGGADAVLGSSAHQVQGAEIYKERPIIYDAGNLLFDFSENCSGGLFQLSLGLSGVEGIRFIPLELHPGYTRLAAEEKAFELTTQFITLSRAFNTEFAQADDETAVLTLNHPPSQSGTPRRNDIPVLNVGKAPLPETAPPLGCAISFDDIPEKARITPVPLGPLELVGLEIYPEQITKVEILFITSYWRIAEGQMQAPEGLLLDIRAVPKQGVKIWSGAHEPCDWSWPTERFQPGIVYRDYYGLRPPASKHIVDGELTITASVLNRERQRLSPRVTVATIPVQMSK